MIDNNGSEFKDSFIENFFEFPHTSKKSGIEAMFRNFDKNIIKICETNDLINRDIAAIVNNWLELDKNNIAITLPGLNTFYKEEKDGNKKLYIPLMFISREDYYDEVYRKNHYNTPKSTRFGEVCLDQTLSEAVLDIIRQVKMFFRNRNVKTLEKTLENSESEEMYEMIEIAKKMRKRR